MPNATLKLNAKARQAELSSMKQWNNIPVDKNGKPIYMRDQVNGLVVFKYRRRDGSFTSHPFSASDFEKEKYIENNMFACKELVSYSTKLRKGLLPKTATNMLHFRKLVNRYFVSVYKIGKFCIQCKRSTHVKSAKMKLSYKGQLLEYDSKPQSIRSTTVRIGKNSNADIKLKFEKNNRFKHIEAGEQYYYSEILGCHLIVNYDGEIANLEMIENLEQIRFIDTSKLENNSTMQTFVDKYDVPKIRRIENVARPSDALCKCFKNLG